VLGESWVLSAESLSHGVGAGDPGDGGADEGRAGEVAREELGGMGRHPRGACMPLALRRFLYRLRTTFLPPNRGHSYTRGTNRPGAFMTSRHALALSTCIVLVFVFVGCGGDGNAPGTALFSQDAVADGRGTSVEPTLAKPASEYALTADDLEAAAPDGSTFAADAERTYVLDAENYGNVVSAEGGEALLNSWGYTGGYETAFVPEGRDAAILNGAYYAVLEVHLFETPEGAAKAFRYFLEKLKNSPAKWMEMPPVGNESGAWTMTRGKLGNSDKARVHSTVLFRRGNLVAVILAIGAEDYVQAAMMQKLAAMVDEKALSEAAALEPVAVATQAAR